MSTERNQAQDLFEQGTRAELYRNGYSPSKFKKLLIGSLVCISTGTGILGYVVGHSSGREQGKQETISQVDDLTERVAGLAYKQFTTDKLTAFASEAKRLRVLSEHLDSGRSLDISSVDGEINFKLQGEQK